MVNDTLAGGFDLNGNPGQPLFVHTPGSTSGMLAVTALTQQLAFSSAGQSGTGEVGNNQNLLALLELKSAKVNVAGSDVPLNDAYAGLVGRVGVPVGRTRPTGRRHRRRRAGPGPARQRQRGEPDER